MLIFRSLKPKVNLLYIFRSDNANHASRDLVKLLDSSLSSKPSVKNRIYLVTCIHNDYWRFTSTSADRVYIFHYQKRCYHVNSKVKLKNQDSRKLHLHQKRQVKRLSWKVTPVYHFGILFFRCGQRSSSLDPIRWNCNSFVLHLLLKLPSCKATVCFIKSVNGDLVSCLWFRKEFEAKKNTTICPHFYRFELHNCWLFM